MKVSIVVPFYNVEKEINVCLDSIFGQTYPNIEVILVNDCSTDDSLTIVERYCAAQQSGFEVIIKNLERNSGASAARNVGIGCATGDYLLFVDSDDHLTPTCVETLVRPLEQKRYDVVIGDIEQTGTIRFTKWRLLVRGGEWNNPQEIFNKHCRQRIYVYPFNKLCRRDLVIQKKLCFEEGTTHEDVLWSLRLCLNIESMYVVKEKTYIRISRDGSVSGLETWEDEVHAYIRLLPLMAESIAESPHKDSKRDINTYFDDIFLMRYRFCFLDDMKEEYFALRALDPKPTSWILKKSLKSPMYAKGNLHRLLPKKSAFTMMNRLLTSRNQDYIKSHQSRLKKSRKAD